MMNDEHIRDLCARAARAEGMEFDLALAELANALDLRESTTMSSSGKPATSLDQPVSKTSKTTISS